MLISPGDGRGRDLTFALELTEALPSENAVLVPAVFPIVLPVNCLRYSAVTKTKNILSYLTIIKT